MTVKQIELISGIDQLSARHKPSVVSIGNYDGVHLGHQSVIKTLIDQSEGLGVPSTVITFNPLAKEYFRPHTVERLTSVDQRAELLFALGVNQVLCIDFTAEFAAYSPEQFVQTVLISGLGVRYLSVGDDFRFGKDRAGDFNFLESSGLNHGFEVSAHNTFTLEGERVSSGRVREALKRSDFLLASQLLGRGYAISGIVSKGQQLGRTIGFPTANVVLDDVLFPVSGVFAVTVSLECNQVVSGVANVGTRPTVDGHENRLEVHLFDFEQDIYGQKITVEFKRKIRDEKKFDSFERLKTQIAKDADSARRYLSDF